MKQNVHDIDIHSAVEELHGLSSKEMGRLLRDSENMTLQLNEGRSSVLIDMEKVAGYLPLHLIAVLLDSARQDLPLVHMLRGIRLLYSLIELAPRYVKIERILLDDLNITEQIIDLIFFLLIRLVQCDQEEDGSGWIIQHASLVACSLVLLNSCVSSQFHELVNVLLAHPEVNKFTEAAFDSVRKDIELFQKQLLISDSKLQNSRTSFHSAEKSAQIMVHNCEVSLQALHSYCLQKSFRESILQNNEFCKNGGVLLLALSILKFQVPSSFVDSALITACVSRMKSKILSILIQLCETEGFSYLDEVADCSKSMQLATSVALEVLELLKTTLSKELKEEKGSEGRSHPKGHVFLNSMRLADIFSDDSNFRIFVMNNITKFLADLSAVQPGVFLSRWCDVNLQVPEEDATVVCDHFLASGAAMLSFKGSGSGSSGSITNVAGDIAEAYTVVGNTLPAISFSSQRTALLVKIFANLHCHVPEICKEQEKDQFFNKFVKCLSEGALCRGNELHFWSEAQTAVRICENFCTLWEHSVHLIPNFLNEEDVQLLSGFCVQLHKSICPSPPRNGSIQEEPMVEYLREKHEKKFISLTQKHQQSSYHGNINNVDFDAKDKINTEMSIDKKIENSPAVDTVFEKDNIQISEEAQSSGGYRNSSVMKQDGNTIDECMSALHIDSDPEEHERKAGDRSLSTVNEVDMDHLKGGIDLSGVQVKVASTDETKIEAINIINSSRKELDIDFNQVDDPGNVVEASTKDDAFAIKNSNLNEHPIIGDDNKISADVGREDENAGFVSQPSENIDCSLFEDEHQKKKRKIINDKNSAVLSTTLQVEAESHWNSTMSEEWNKKFRTTADSDPTTSQLKNWLNSQGAMLGSVGCEYKDQSEVCQKRPSINELATVATAIQDSPESNSGEGLFVGTMESEKSLNPGRFSISPSTRLSTEDLNRSSPEHFSFKGNSLINFELITLPTLNVGQTVVLTKANGTEAALAIVLQVEGSWHGVLLKERNLCVVEVKQLYVDKLSTLPYPSDFAGNTFEEAEIINRKMIVIWNTTMILLRRNVNE